MHGEFLALAHTPNDAKQIENHLRGNGHKVRVIVAPGLDSFSDILSKSEIELVLFDESYREASLLEVVEAVAHSRPGTPVVVMVEDLNPHRYLDALDKGAQATVSMSDLAHMECVLQREFATHRLRHENAALRVKLAEAESAHAAMMGTADEPMIQVQEGIVVKTNKALAEMLGLDDADELAGLPLMDLVASADQPRVKERISKCLKGKDCSEPITFILSDNGKEGPTLEARLIRTELDGDPAIEIIALPRADKPAEVAGTALGINRRELYHALSAGPPDKSEGIHAFIFIRVDEFPQLEERVGFAGAEELVHALIDLLRQVTDARDTVLQFSVHEFVVVGQRKELDEVTSAVRRFQRGVARHIFKADDKEVSITTSAIVYPLPEGGEDPDETISRVRKAVSSLEAAGGGEIRVTGSRAEDLERKKEAGEWARRINAAIEDDRFELAFQNIASLTGDERQTSDVLLRMLDEKGKEILARDFIPYAEEAGLMPRLDRWVVAHAMQRLEELSGKGKPACLFVRLSEPSLAAGEAFIEWLESEIKAHPSDGCELILTLRERILQNHMKKAQWLAKKSKALGLGIAIDHFGINRNSPQLLSRLSIDYLKLHADFTETIGKPGGDLKPLESIMESARQHKIKTIAERVTDANSMARLWQLGVNYIMGSHVHEPETGLTDTRFSLR